MAVHGTTSTKMVIEAVELWLNQFDREDRSDAKRLLSVIRNVTADEFYDAMTGLVRSRVEADPSPVGLFVETERGHRRGRAHRLFSEPDRKHRRAVGSSPLISPARTVDPEVGSEGLVSLIVTEVFRQNKKRSTIHPGPDMIRRRKIRRFILVTDFIGSGDRISRYLDAAWRVRSVRSWWSARRSRGMSFEVVAYSATEAGLQKVKTHPTRPIVHIIEGCPTIQQAFLRLPEARSRMEKLCTRYGSFNPNMDPLGYGGTGALITFAHGIPNNAPVIFHKRSNLKTKPWIPLYPERVTSGRRTGSITIAKRREAIQLGLQRVARQKVLLSPRLSSAPPFLRDAVHVLLSLDRAPSSATVISARTGLPVNRVRDALARSHTYRWVDDDNRIADKGYRELARLGAPIQREISFQSAILYIPRSLRAPELSR